MEKKKSISFLLILTLTFNILSSWFTESVKAAENEINFTIENSVDKTEAFTGEEFTYTIKYANPNTKVDGKNVVIKDVLPANIEYISSTPSTHIESTMVEKVDGQDVVTFKFQEILPAGSTGIIKITAKFPEGTTLATIDGSPNVAINEASIEGDNGQVVISNKVIVTPKLKSPDWKVEKKKIIPSVTPAVGGKVTYQIKVTGNSKIGGLNLRDVSIVDNLPTGAEYISSSHDGVYEDGKVTWFIGDLPVGSEQIRTVTVKYSEDLFKIGDNVTNLAIAYGKLLGSDEEIDKTSSVTHSFSSPIVGVGGFAKIGRQDNDRYSVGQEAEFSITGIENTGNVSLDRIEIADKIPEDIVLTNISTGKYNYDALVEVQYKIIEEEKEEDEVREEIKEEAKEEEIQEEEENKDVEEKQEEVVEVKEEVESKEELEIKEEKQEEEKIVEKKEDIWISFNGSPFSGAENHNISIPAGQKIQEIRWVITGVGDGLEPGFKDVSPIKVQGIVSMPKIGNKITNHATLNAFKDGNPPIVKEAHKDIYVIDALPWPVIEKKPDNGIKFNMKDRVEYTIRVKNHEFATGEYINPIILDTLPEEMENLKIIGWNRGNSNINLEPTVDTSPKNLIKWEFTGTLNQGEYVEVRYSAKIKDKTLAGYVSNYAYATTNSQGEFENQNEAIADVKDLDGDGSTSDKLIQTSTKIFVNFTGSLESQKWVKGELDSDWGYYGVENGYGKTLPGGIADYRLKVRNNGANGPISNIVVIDVLPYIGDKGLLDTSSRDTAWKPYIVNRITGENGGPLPTGVKVYYSTNSNPSKQELYNPEVNKGLPGDGWSETPPRDITSVRSLKFDFGALKLQPNEEVILEWPMRAPYEAPKGKVAWNSFAYGATYPDLDKQEPFLPSEPKKVGFEVQDDPLATHYIGNFVWEDLNKNGIQEAGEPGINGVLVNLYRKGEIDSFRYTRTGDSFKNGVGYYDFPNLPNGTYIVEFVFPKDYKVTPHSVGGDREKDSNIDWSKRENYIDNDIEKYSIKTGEIVINNNNDWSIDAGLYRLASLGDRVWHDKNANGIQDGSEPGISGVKVTLLDMSGNSLNKVITDSNGNYKFNELEPGQYKVEFENPNGHYKFSDANKGSDRSKDSNGTALADGLKAETLITLKSG